MTPALLITIAVEGILAGAYSIWREKPVGLILVTSILVNIATQSLLWAMLNLFFRHYFLALWIAEFLIWLIESFLLYGFRLNRLDLQESLCLSFSMNLVSFTLGLLLPV